MARSRSRTPTTKPAVGRIVHFHRSASDVPSAAIVTRVHEDDDGNLLVCLTVFHVGQVPTHVMTVGELDPSAEKDEDFRGRWSWPPRE